MYSAAQESSTTQEPSAAQESSRLYTHARCSLLGKYYPYSLVCGAHLFKYGWREKVYDVLSFKNINDVKNGLLLLKWVGGIACVAVVSFGGGLSGLDKCSDDISEW